MDGAISIGVQRSAFELAMERLAGAQSAVGALIQALAELHGAWFAPAEPAAPPPPGDGATVMRELQTLLTAADDANAYAAAVLADLKANEEPAAPPKSVVADIGTILSWAALNGLGDLQDVPTINQHRRERGAVEFRVGVVASQSAVDRWARAFGMVGAPMFAINAKRRGLGLPVFMVRA